MEGLRRFTLRFICFCFDFRVLIRLLYLWPELARCSEGEGAALSFWASHGGETKIFEGLWARILLGLLAKAAHEATLLVSEVLLHLG